MRSATDRAVVAVDARLDRAINLLATLVQCPSTLGRVRPAQELLYRELRRTGLEAHIEDPDPEALTNHPAHAPVAWSQRGQPNVWAVLPPTGGSGGRTLALNGHIDVVPAEPIDWWSYDPWGATIDGGRMYGRGALDMKSGLVAGLLAIQAVIDADLERRGPVIFESVIEEECTGNGMLAQRLRTGPVDGAVILEPTGLQLWTATTGVVWFDVVVRGKPAYVGRAADAVNAVEAAAALIGRLKPAVVDELNAAFSHHAFAHIERPLTLNVGVIEGGMWPSNVPLECRFTCRMSYPIDWTFADARTFVERHIVRAAEPDPWLATHPPTVRFPGFRALGWEATDDTPLHRALDACHEAELGETPSRTVFPGTADARYFDAAAGEQVIYYGPAGGNIHAPDEYVDLASIRQTARVVVRLIAEWCG